MTAPDPGLTDLTPLEMAEDLNRQASDLSVMAAHLEATARKICPPCGHWLDGHSYRKCGQPKGHGGNCG